MLAAEQAPIGRRFWIALGACAVASLVPLWSVKYLPMADLPQHAALVSAWLHLDDPTWGFAEQFERHLFTPYVLTYLLAAWMAKAVGVLAALKILVTLAVLGLPLAMVRMARRRGADPWWALWGFALAFGLPFRWGFVAYLVAVPLGVLLVDEGDAFARAPDRRRGIRLAALGLVLFFTHLVVLLVAAAIVAVLVPLRGARGRQVLSRLAPLAPPALLTGLWMLLAAGRDDRVGRWEWNLTWRRLTMLPQYLFDAPFPAELTRPVIDHGASTMALAFAVALALARPKPSRSLADWFPSLAAAALFLLSPFSAYTGVLIADRFALLVPTFALAALAPGAEDRARRAARGITVVAVVGWMAVLTAGFRQFDRLEMAPFERVAGLVAKNRRVDTLLFDAQSAFVGGPPALVNVGGWVQAAKGGVFPHNFGAAVNLPVQYRPGREPRRTVGIQWDPTLLDWSVEGAADYFLVRSPAPPEALFRGAPVPVVLIAREADWWLYRPLKGAAP